MEYSRTNIYLLVKDKKELTKIAEDQGMKFSELVRRLMRECINKNNES